MKENQSNQSYLLNGKHFGEVEYTNFYNYFKNSKESQLINDLLDEFVKSKNFKDPKKTQELEETIHTIAMSNSYDMGKNSPLKKFIATRIKNQMEKLNVSKEGISQTGEKKETKIDNKISLEDQLNKLTNSTQNLQELEIGRYGGVGDMRKLSESNESKIKKLKEKLVAVQDRFDKRWGINLFGKRTDKDEIKVIKIGLAHLEKTAKDIRKTEKILEEAQSTIKIFSMLLGENRLPLDNVNRDEMLKKITEAMDIVRSSVLGENPKTIEEMEKNFTKINQYILTSGNKLEQLDPTQSKSPKKPNDSQPKEDVKNLLIRNKDKNDQSEYSKSEYKKIQEEYRKTQEEQGNFGDNLKDGKTQEDLEMENILNEMDGGDETTDNISKVTPGGDPLSGIDLFEEEYEESLGSNNISEQSDISETSDIWNESLDDDEEKKEIEKTSSITPRGDENIDSEEEISITLNDSNQSSSPQPNLFGDKTIPIIDNNEEVVKTSTSNNKSKSQTNLLNKENIKSSNNPGPSPKPSSGNKFLDFINKFKDAFNIGR